MDGLIKVHAQLVIDLELGEMSVSGTQLDINGLASAVKEFLENLPMTGPQMRVVEVSSPTKTWQIAGQLTYAEAFDPNPCICRVFDGQLKLMENCPKHNNISEEN